MFPARIVTYMAGITVPLLLGVVHALVRRHPEVKRVDYVVGDRPFYEWARAQRDVDSRIVFRYQHERMDPFRPRPLDRARLAELEARYGKPHLAQYLAAQRAIEHLSEDHKLTYLQTYLEYFEDLAHELKPDLYLGGSPDSLPFMAAFEVFRANGVESVLLAPGRLPGRFFIVENEFEQIRGLTETYEATRRRELTAAERATADEIRARYVRRRERPVYYRLRTAPPSLPSVRRFVAAWRRRATSDERYFDFPLSFYVKRSFLVRLRRPLQEAALRRAATAEVGAEPFFYMPLNYEPECNIDIQSGVYRDQVAMVERVARALPAGHVLYVKEHPNMLPGARPLGFYQRLVRLGGVRMLPRERDSYEILSRCRGVITIGGTTGVEALFYGKPVLLLGHAYYEAFGDGVLRPEGFEEIAPALQRMAWGPPFRPDLFDRFVIAVLERSYPGAYELMIDGATTTANYELIAEGVAQEVQALQGTR